MIYWLIVSLEDYKPEYIYKITVNHLKVRTGAGVHNAQVDIIDFGDIVKFNTFRLLDPSQGYWG